MLDPLTAAIRSESQQGLARALDPARRALWTEAQIGRLTDFVGSKADPDSDAAEDMAVVVQEIVGRLFDQEYAADRASWRAAEQIDRFRDGVSPVQIIWLITGRLRHARNPFAKPPAVLGRLKAVERILE